MERNFLSNVVFTSPPSAVLCILYCLLSKAMHAGLAPGTITFNCQSATSTFVAALITLQSLPIGFRGFLSLYCTILCSSVHNARFVVYFYLLYHCISVIVLNLVLCFVVILALCSIVSVLSCVTAVGTIVALWLQLYEDYDYYVTFVTCLLINTQYSIPMMCCRLVSSWQLATRPRVVDTEPPGPSGTPGGEVWRWGSLRRGW